MKAQELRIGNFVLHNGNWSYRSHSAPSVISWEESDWYALGECTISLEDVSPIPLTEQWLIDFGFERGVDYWFKSDVILDISPEGLSYRFHHNIIQYIHQLQNLYFALTGEELQL